MKLKNAPRKLKDNRFLRGLYHIWRRDFGSQKRSVLVIYLIELLLPPPILGI